MAEHFSFDEFKKHQNVSRETFLRLESYVELLKKWQEKINLVSKATLPVIWTRHILDSAQLIDYIDKDKKIMDLGSGAGLPGVVLSIMGIEPITLIESDLRKATFLQEAIRVTECKANVIAKRVEKLDASEVDIVTARAFAPTKTLLTLTQNLRSESTTLLLLKGRSVREELEEAKTEWEFEAKLHPSKVETESYIVEIRNITPKVTLAKRANL